MRIINFNDGYTSAAAPTIDVAASGVSVVASNGLVATNAQAAFDELQVDSNAYAAHVASTANPHSVTKTQVGLSAVTNDAQVKRTEMGVASGVATLDGSGTVPMAQMPAAILGANIYQGTWNALTNSPALASSSGTKGYFYYVSSAGTTNLNGVTDWQINDIAIFNGSAWQKIDNTDAVTSVAGRTGIVVLTSTDVGLANVDNTSDATKNAASVTLTNKTITSPVVTGGTFATPSLTTPVIGSAGADFTGATSGTSTLRAASVAGGSMVIPSGTDTLTANGQVQTLQNKTLTAPLFNSYWDITEQGSAPSSPGAGKLRVYGKTADESLYFLNSSGIEKQVGSGSGEKNYIATGSNTAAGWTASGAGITVATDTTGSELPRPNTTATGIKVTGASGSTAYAYFRFILDDADANKKLKFQFDLKPVTGYVASDFRIDVYSNTASDYTTGNTRLALSTDASAVSALPALTGTYRSTFDAPAIAAKWIEIRIGLNGTNTHSLVVSDLVVGPGVLQQGTASTEWVTYTPTVSGLGTGTTTTLTGKWRRIGDSMQIGIYMLENAAGSGSSTVKWTIPSGLTIDSSKLNGTFGSGRDNVGSATTYRIVAAAQIDRQNEIFPASTTELAVTKPLTAGGFLGSDFVTTAEIWMSCTVPIAEWAGSGTVNVVQNDAEYASNSSLTDAADTTSFVYGPAGSQGVFGTTALTAARSKRVRFLTPISPTDRLFLEVKGNNATDPWLDITVINPTPGLVNFTYQNSVTYGLGIKSQIIGSTDIDVSFGQYSFPSGASYGAAGQSWVSVGAFLWRVRKVSGGQAIGFSEVQPGVSSGLVSANGLKAVADNSNAPVGYVGEYKESKVSVNTAVGTSAQYADLTSLTLTAGEWDVVGSVAYLRNSATFTSTDLEAGISGTAGNSATGLVDGVTLQYQIAVAPVTFSGVTLVTPTVRVQSDGTNLYINGATISSAQVVYLKSFVSVYTAGTPQYRAVLRARRVR